MLLILPMPALSMNWWACHGCPRDLKQRNQTMLYQQLGQAETCTRRRIMEQAGT